MHPTFNEWRAGFVLVALVIAGATGCDSTTEPSVRNPNDLPPLPRASEASAPPSSPITASPPSLLIAAVSAPDARALVGPPPGVPTSQGEASAAQPTMQLAAGPSPDILVEDWVSGARGYFTMSGPTLGTFNSIGTVAPDFHQVGYADFSGDNQPDLLFENLLDGARWVLQLTSAKTPVTWLPLYSVPTAWHIAGTGSFTGSTTPDIVFQNTNSGEVGLRWMSRTVLQGWIPIGLVPKDFRAVTVGDFTGDGMPDLVFENSQDGERWVLQMSGTTAVAWRAIGSLPRELRIRASGDFTGDGQLDLLFENDLTGARSILAMVGTTAQAWFSLTTWPSTWHITGTAPVAPTAIVPPTVLVTTSASSVTQGQSVTVSWSSTNAVSCTASWNGGTAISASGSQVFQPQTTTAYTVTCVNPGGTGSDTKTVTWTAAVAPTVVVTTSASNVTQGQSVTVSWSSTGAVSCTASWNGGTAIPASGSQVFQPQTTTAYTVTCVNPGGTGSDTKTVTITATPWAGVCESIRPLAGTSTDASSAIQQCIASANSGTVVALPRGKYMIGSQIQVNKPITLTSEGKSPSDPKCNAGDDPSCAEVIAVPTFYAYAGLLMITASGATVDHLVVNGAHDNRLQSQAAVACQGGSNRYGYNMSITASDVTVSNSVSKNGLCGTALEVTSTRSGITLYRNTFAWNGYHQMYLLFADGVTVHNGVNSRFTENEFIDNSDVDFILGGCQNCIVQGNTISHSDTFAGSSFAALMLYHFSTGDYTGSDISGNTVDCGVNKRCGFGLYVGGDAWNLTSVFGGSVHDNQVRNAQQGVNVDKTTGTMRFYNNFASNSGGGTLATCGFRQTGLYNISPESILDRSLDTIPDDAYTREGWDGCIPNWIQ